MPLAEIARFELNNPAYAGLRMDQIDARWEQVVPGQNLGVLSRTLISDLTGQQVTFYGSASLSNIYCACLFDQTSPTTDQGIHLAPFPENATGGNGHLNARIIVRAQPGSGTVNGVKNGYTSRPVLGSASYLYRMVNDVATALAQEVSSGKVHQMTAIGSAIVLRIWSPSSLTEYQEWNSAAAPATTIASNDTYWPEGSVGLSQRYTYLPNFSLWSVLGQSQTPTALGSPFGNINALGRMLIR